MDVKDNNLPAGTAETTEALSRRGLMRLAGAVAAIGAGLGVTLESAEARQEIKEGRVQFKVYGLRENGDESHAELVANFKILPAEEARLLSVPRGRLQLKVYCSGVDTEAIKNAEPVFKQMLQLDTAQVKMKLGSPIRRA